MYEQFFIIFALVILGFFLGRREIMDEGTNAGINKLIMRFIVPCMFVYKIGSLEMTGETMREFFLTVGVFTAEYENFHVKIQMLRSFAWCCQITHLWDFL